MSLTRRNFIVASGSAATWAATGGYGRAAEFSYKLGSPLPTSHPISARSAAAADAIRKETGGRLDIQVFADGQLGSNSDMLSQARSGALELFPVFGGVLNALVPAASLINVGFVFNDYEQVWRAMDGPVHKYIQAETAKKGLTLLDRPMDSGFRHFTTTTRAIQTVEDLKGLKIRAPIAPVYSSLISALGGSPTNIQFNELYTALQTKVVDGQENPLSIIHSNKIYEVQKYCALTNHIWDAVWISANPRAWAQLPPDLRAIAVKHFDAACLAEREDTAKLDASLQKELEGFGMQFTKPDIASFREHLRKGGFYASWKSKFGDDAWALLEQVVGRLA
jgi:tripartite ATP-independent transporter DctP family solute receptor